jgi:maleylacetate reductase
VIFGVGAFARLREEVERVGANRPLFISTPGRRNDAERAASSLAGMTAKVHAESVMHVPIDTLNAARNTAQRHAADSIIAFGGGSAIDTSKAVGLELGLPVVAVPTTRGR